LVGRFSFPSLCGVSFNSGWWSWWSQSLQASFQLEELLKWMLWTR